MGETERLQELRLDEGGVKAAFSSQERVPIISTDEDAGTRVVVMGRLLLALRNLSSIAAEFSRPGNGLSAAVTLALWQREEGTAVAPRPKKPLLQLGVEFSVRWVNIGEIGITGIASLPSSYDGNKEALVLMRPRALNEGHSTYPWQLYPRSLMEYLGALSEWFLSLLDIVETGRSVKDLASVLGLNVFIASKGCIAPRDTTGFLTRPQL